MESTITPESAAEVIWDAVVIGAGPAGALTAERLANGGRRVLLLDAKKFPREKVCGGCINELALSVLAKAGLKEVISGLPFSPLEEYVLNLHSRILRIAAVGGIAISRASLDLALVRAATRAGADFLDGTTGSLVPIPERLRSSQGGSDDEWRHVQIEVGGHAMANLRSRVVVIADGLARKSLQRTSELPIKISANSWIGLHSTFPVEDDQYPAGQVRMLISRAGYVGTVRIENDTVNLAAAVSPRELKRYGTPEKLVTHIFESAHVAFPPKIADMNWQGTGPLTRRSQSVAGERVMVIGDAAGYVEPFTGEGVGHAVCAAVELAEILLSSKRAWDPQMSTAWNDRYRRQVSNRQWICRGLAMVLHHPLVAELSFRLAALSPAIPQFVADHLNTPIKGTAAL